MRTLTNTTLIYALTLTALTVLFAGKAAQAFPAFSQKEKKPCLYCHVNPGGGGKRNAAGLWYKNHALSFAGYTPEKANAEAGLNVKPTPVATPKAKVTPKPKAKTVAKKATKPVAAKKPAPKPPATKKG
ncbi:MAG: hypothetical protein H7145_16985 [Akkermansiaceae bacterium]|nr:hypothetical protein [Armatimonadota bacterium]